MAKDRTKAAHKPSAKASPFKDKKFQRFIRNATISAVEADDSILTGRAAALVGDLDDDEIAEICESCMARNDAHEAGSMEEIGRGPLTLGSFSGRILDFILNIDPRVKQVIIDTILKYIGLKDSSPLAAAASPAASLENQSREPSSNDPPEAGTNDQP